MKLTPTKENFLKSLIFHLIIAILLVVSTWSIFSRRDTVIKETPIVVSLAPMGEKTNLKPAPRQATKPPTPKKAVKPPEPKKAPPKPPEPKKVEPKAVPKVEPKKVEKKPEKKPEKDALDKELEKLEKEEAEAKAMLKDESKDKKPEKSSNEAVTKADSKSDQAFDANSPEALAEQDYIVKLITDQVKDCWRPPAGMRGAKDMIVSVNVDIDRGGNLKFVDFASGQNYQTAADAAKRAVLNPECNPLRNLPPIDKYSIWKEMTLIFDPKDFAN